MISIYIFKIHSYKILRLCYISYFVLLFWLQELRHRPLSFQLNEIKQIIYLEWEEIFTQNEQQLEKRETRS